MVLNLLNWCWIFLSTYLTGWAVSLILGKILKCPLRSVPARLVMGLVFVSVYAEAFSLVYKVGLAATLGLLVLCLFSLVIVRKDIRPTFDRVRVSIRAVPSWKFLTAAIIGAFFLIVSAATPYLGDTYLYHLQAVKWIEQYGAVKGLGNLHFRFAYNSAFECLAALYSWSSWGAGLSLHAVNGFYAALMVSYCALTFRWRPRKGRIPVSDLLKLSTVIYIFGRLLSYGSGDTDPLVMHCIAFIFIRWFELLEERPAAGGEKKRSAAVDLTERKNYASEEERSDRGRTSHDRTSRFALLSILGVYACTVKLSAAPVVVLALYPIIRLLKEKRGKVILLFVLLAAVIAAPYLIRNVMISGYLIYPVTAIDLFNVDWKMPKSVIQVDRDGIIMWGRAIQYQDNPMAMGIREWLPIWFASLNVEGQILFLLSCVACAGWLVHMIAAIVNACRDRAGKPGNRVRVGREDDFSGKDGVAGNGCAQHYQQHPQIGVDFAVSASVVCFLFWMSSSPLLRYGELYMWIVAMAVFGSYLSVSKILMTAASMVLLSEVIGLPANHFDSVGLFLPADYSEEFGMVDHETGLTYEDGSPVLIYTPDENAGMMSDYWYFPETPEQGQLDALEFRGDSLKDGFRSTEPDS